MLGPTSLFMAEGADWKWQRRAVAPSFRHDKLLALVPTFSAIAVRTVMARNDLIPDRSCLGDNCITLA
jgi:cytochrome P450